MNKMRIFIEKNLLSTIIGVVFLLVSSQGNAMIETLSLFDLVSSSEWILLARLESKSELPPAAEGQLPLLKNVLSCAQCLKGEWSASSPVEILTIGPISGRPRIEDNVRFPEAPYQVLLFLHTNKNGKIDLVNSWQGMWPMNPTSRKFEGMGLGTSLEQVLTEIETQEKRKQ
ncbi:MAG: hypothetical protein WA705_11635 [Candidatus Ozemobacteraceae bacterium]